jgi:hypothetical protein
MVTAPFQTYVPPGPIAAGFLASDARVRGIMGPIGSGKTAAALMDMIYRAKRQAPHPRDNVRRTKFAVIRATYRDLERTTIPSWLRWFPKALFPDWHGGTGGQPAQHVIRGALNDGTTFEMIVQFVAVGENTAEDTARGLELTGAMLEEGDLLPDDLLDWMDDRLGRYPAVDHAAGFAGCTWEGITTTFNAPDVEHPFYKMFVEDLVEADPKGDVAFFEQPGAAIEIKRGVYKLNPAAENLRNLPVGYYEKKLQKRKAYWKIRRMILNKWGATREGEPVYTEYQDDLHCPAYPLDPLPGRPLIIGLDAQLHAAMVVTQRSSLGQWRVTDEQLCPNSGWGAPRFAKACVQLLQERYPSWVSNWGRPHQRERPAIKFWYDPTAKARGGADEKIWITEFAAEVQKTLVSCSFAAAPSNSPGPRRDAVRRPLEEFHGEPDFQIDRRCKMTRKGFNSGYRLHKVLVPGSVKMASEPEKNEFSHPHDALQYAMLGGGEWNVILAGGTEAAAARQQRGQPTQSEEYRPF